MHVANDCILSFDLLERKQIKGWLPPPALHSNEQDVAIINHIEGHPLCWDMLEVSNR